MDRIKSITLVGIPYLFLIVLIFLSEQIGTESKDDDDDNSNVGAPVQSSRCLENQLLLSSSEQPTTTNKHHQILKSAEEDLTGSDTLQCLKKFKKDQSSTELKKSTMAAGLTSLQFEVFGKVQGVFFRKYTMNKGKELGLRGWCQNTSQGTVIGEVEGPPTQVNQMKEWLTKTGSPKSKISKVDFRNEKNIDKYKFSDFAVRK